MNPDYGIYQQTQKVMQSIDEIMAIADAEESKTQLATFNI
jgi:hypothetical protein